MFKGPEDTHHLVVAQRVVAQVVVVQVQVVVVQIQVVVVVVQVQVVVVQVQVVVFQVTVVQVVQGGQYLLGSLVFHQSLVDQDFLQGKRTQNVMMIFVY